MLKALVQDFAIGANRANSAPDKVQLGEQAARLPSANAGDRLLARASVAAMAQLALAPSPRPRLVFSEHLAPALLAERRELPARASELLARWLREPAVPLVEDALRVVAQRRLRVPLALQPRLLETIDAPARRKWLEGVACAGTRWLAAQNPDWSWALEGADDGIGEDFDTATGPARVAAFARLRARDAAQARERLAQAFGENDADERAALLAALAEGLSPQDEPFLESALDDRAKSVRLAAVELLCRLPASAFAKRARERVLPMVVLERGLLRKALRVSLPDKPDKTEERDGCDGKGTIPGLHSAGPRQLQLAQRIAQVPVLELAAQLGLEPRDMVERFADQEFALPLLAGLCVSASRNPVPSAVLALSILHDRAVAQGLYAQWIRPLLPALPEFDRYIAMRLRAGSIDVGLLQDLPAPWPDDLTQELLAWSRHGNRRSELANDHSHGGYVQLVKLAATRIAPSAEALRGWPDFHADTATSSQRHAAEAIDEFLATLRARHDFLTFLEMP